MPVGSWTELQKSLQHGIVVIYIWPLAAFLPQLQIAGDLGRNVTHSPNAHLQAIPERERNVWRTLWPQIQTAAGLNTLRFEHRKPYLPIFEVAQTPQVANPHAAIAELVGTHRNPCPSNRDFQFINRSFSKRHGFTKTLFSLFCLEVSVHGTILVKRMVARRRIFCFKGQGS